MNFTTNHTTPIKSIRAFCTSCVASNKKAIRECDNTICPLYPYRMGVRPNTESKLINLQTAINIANNR